MAHEMKGGRMNKIILLSGICSAEKKLRNNKGIQSTLSFYPLFFFSLIQHLSRLCLRENLDDDYDDDDHQAIVLQNLLRLIVYYSSTFFLCCAFQLDFAFLSFSSLNSSWEFFHSRTQFLQFQLIFLKGEGGYCLIFVSLSGF